MSNYIIYRSKADNKITRVQKAMGKYTLVELKDKAANWIDPNRTCSIIADDLVGEILDYLDEKETLENNWKTSIKKEFLEMISRSQSELNDLEHWVNSFDDPEEDKADE